MAALLMAIAVISIMMTVAMPVWKQTAQREKEDELVFRGMQYVHAIALFQRKTANAFPPSVQVLVDQRFLRKKYKDPITNDDFQLLTAGQNAGASGANTQGQRGAQPGAPTPGGATATGGQRATAPIGTSPAGIGVAAAGGITGVASKSKDKSIRIYNGRTHYNEWAFIFTPQLQAPGAGAAGTAAPGQRGGQPQRGQPGQQPVGAPGPLGGQRGGRGNPQAPGGRGPGGFGQPGFPGSVQPLQPVQPTQPGRGRSGD
jgi:type II secretory pathway pseudopilin PulG